MVTKFNTAQAPAQSGSGGSMKTILIVGALLVGGYLLWKYVLNKPKKEEEKKTVE